MSIMNTKINRLALSLAAICLPLSVLAETLEETAANGRQTFDLSAENSNQTSDSVVSGMTAGSKTAEQLALDQTAAMDMGAGGVPSPTEMPNSDDPALSRMSKGAENGFKGTALIGPKLVLKTAENIEKEAHKTGKPLSDGGKWGLFVGVCVAAALSGLVGGVFGLVLGAPAGAISEAVSPGSTKDWVN